MNYKNEIIKMKLDIAWIKKLGMYVAGVLTIQLITNIMGVIK